MTIVTYSFEIFSFNEINYGIFKLLHSQYFDICHSSFVISFQRLIEFHKNKTIEKLLKQGEYDLMLFIYFYFFVIIW